jgi:hypothetical protein
MKKELMEMLEARKDEMIQIRRYFMGWSRT